MLIDLTHSLQEGISIYPGTTKPRFTPSNTIEKDGFAELEISMTTHAGTHMDAPCHILPGAQSLDQLPIEQFTGPGLCLDCKNLNSITSAFLEAHSAQIEQVEFVLFYAGWQEKWSTNDYFSPWPTLTRASAQWLTQFNLKALGFDTISVDAMDAHSLPNHHILLSQEILIIENLTNLDRLLGQIFDFYAIPIKIKDADGSPIRAFASLES